ncbi:MAG: proline--tRNA ligase [Armatimonadetes bacterium]|nr:proline--tRNA ligase [Armatimonadota bacterium]
MKADRYLLPTLREVPADAELASHQLLLRAGYIRQLAAGVWSYLPLAWRVIRRVEQVIREEMEAIGCLETRLPTLTPKELLTETGRWDVPVVYKLSDRRDAEYALGFTHEEAMCDIVRREVRSWRQLPLLMFQHQTKFRDEPRPRGGTLRTREFIMFDAYSFDRDVAGMDASFDTFAQSYRNIFNRMGLPFVEAEADGGDIGDLDNREFLILTDAGEDTVLRCAEANFAANAEACACPDIAPTDPDVPEEALQTVPTPGARTIEEVAWFLKVAPQKLIKTLVYVADGTPVVVLLCGDREVNEIKLRRFIGAKDLALASEAIVESVTGAPVGFAGVVGLKQNVRMIADYEVRYVRNGVTGANAADAHITGVNPGRDFTPADYADARVAVAGDPCPVAPQYLLTDARGIEVGHIFKLGTKYSEPLKAAYVAENGEQSTILMGSYGIGNSRLLAALIEASHDENGIIWHPSVAPLQVVVIVGNIKDEPALAAAETLHDELERTGISVMLDNRDERIGVKFKDADLIGYPVRVVFGKGFASGTVEIKARRDAKDAAKEVTLNGAVDAVRERLAELSA